MRTFKCEMDAKLFIIFEWNNELPFFFSLSALPHSHCLLSCAMINVAKTASGHLLRTTEDGDKKTSLSGDDDDDGTKRNGHEANHIEKRWQIKICNWVDSNKSHPKSKCTPRHTGEEKCKQPKWPDSLCCAPNMHAAFEPRVNCAQFYGPVKCNS